MNVTQFDEPLLEFGRGLHFDVRAGIAAHGVLDHGASHVPVPIRVGLVGTPKTTEGVRGWLERCRYGVGSKEQRLVELRPDFPGMTEDAYGTRLELTDATTRSITQDEISAAIGARGPTVALVASFLGSSAGTVG